MNNSDKVYIKLLTLFMLQFFILTGIWGIDIGASAMCWEQTYDNGDAEGQAQGLGFIRSANAQYHLGLIIVYIVFIVQAAWMLNLILMNRIKEKKE